MLARTIFPRINKRCVQARTLRHRRQLPINQNHARWGHVELSPPFYTRCSDLFHRRAGQSWQPHVGGSHRSATRRGEANAARAPLWHQRLGCLARSSALRLDPARRGFRLSNTLAADQDTVFTAHACGALAAIAYSAWRAGHLAAQVLGTSYPGQCGFRGACPVLLDQSRQTWFCPVARRMALFIHSQGHCERRI